MNHIRNYHYLGEAKFCINPFEEPLRFITFGFLACARIVKSPCRWPKLCDYVYPPFSDITTVLQYYSQLLRGSGRRLRLLYGLDGHASSEAWLAAPTNRPLAPAFVRTTLSGNTWTRRRQAVYFADLPWLWAVLPDTRVPLSYRRPTSMIIHIEP